MSSLSRLREEARTLSATERADLILDLLKSLDAAADEADVERAWNDEAARRLAQFDREGGATLSAAELHAQARARLR